MRFPVDIARLVAEYVPKWQVKQWILERAPKFVGEKRDMRGYRHLYGDCIGETDDYDDAPQDIDEYYLSDHEDYKTKPKKGEKFTIVIDGKETDEYGECECCSFSNPWCYNADFYIWKNPRAEEFARGRCIDWTALGDNPADWAIDLIETLKVDSYPSYALCGNTNPRVLEILKKCDPTRYQFHLMSSNPIMIPWLEEHPEWIDIDALLTNPGSGSKELNRKSRHIASMGNADIYSNPAHWAIELMKKKEADGLFDPDVNILFASNPHPWMVERILKYPLTSWDDRTRECLYRNPNPIVMDYIRDNPSVFKLSPMIWSNPEIFELQTDPDVINELMQIDF